MVKTAKTKRRAPGPTRAAIKLVDRSIAMHDAPMPDDGGSYVAQLYEYPDPRRPKSRKTGAPKTTAARSKSATAGSPRRKTTGLKNKTK